MVCTMIHRSLSYDPTPEHRLTRAKWARGVSIIYGTILLLLLTFIAAHRSLNEPGGATAVASDHTAHSPRAAAKSSSRTN
jgi:flagellin-like protein